MRYTKNDDLISLSLLLLLFLFFLFLLFLQSSSSVVVDVAAMGEARGLISDLLADPSLPPGTCSSLKAVSSLLSTTVSLQPLHRLRSEEEEEEEEEEEGERGAGKMERLAIPKVDV
ncbi:cGMP-inhibited 3',5'-cyclic phosphodiesterase A [Liparis tanakae]|uniref:cGMP-inhibited 3',5'-cyclic phosphodiesterase A n=1 Tax=Liparis tanakae TaxID=230148 RepID=A0A4Z2E947_9TELE|nr:cGMP-inhibited 3',5'-cyclic phosphodiesterase A [Liparis tanakae]